MVLSLSKPPMISGYSIIEEIYSSQQTLVYRGVREADQKPVVIKLMRNEYPTSQEIAQFRNQYFISNNLNTSTIIKPYSLEKYHRSYAFVMEDFGGISIINEVKDWKFSKIGDNYDLIENFLDIAIQITSALDEIHRNKIIHKDIKPDNILINPDTKEIKIIDFSISTILPQGIQFLVHSDILEGTLAYISPEQTGRVNRGIDYRTDYYSLGITLFELLTGKLPFNNDNTLGLIYSHISQEPPVETIIDLGIPLVISELVGKLMAKNPEDRYQSALGLKHDLELCQHNLKTNRRIGHFELATKDISDHFSIPDKLYGRQVETKKLLDAFNRVINPPQHHLAREKEARKGVELMLVKGYSGTGKTAVVSEIHKPILQEKGYFIKGKFNQLQQDIPFLGWVEALNDLIEQLLSESNRQIEQWKTDILSALGDQAQVIIDLIPKLALIIGAQPKATEVSGIEAQNRLGFLFQKLISTFAIRKHPLVIFLDDLQWADAASLNIIKLLMSENSTRNNSCTLQNVMDIQMPNFNIETRNEYDDALLLIGAYRHNEIDYKHLLNSTIEDINNTNVNISHIHLKCLNQSELAFLISDTLKCEVNDIVSFTEVVFAKTKGNPFFIHQFINTLYKDEVIKFNYDVGNWECDVANVRKFALTDDVVELMTLQIQKLPYYTQKLLKIAACIGSQFDLDTLSKMSQKSEEATITHLWDSVLQGLVLPVEKNLSSSNVENQITELIIDSEDEKEVPLGHRNARHFKFIHDRLQQAAYSQIPESEKQQIHLQLGKQLLEGTSAESWEEDVFETANQFNKALSLITVQQERYELAKINLLAGQKAISSTAYEAALSYLTIGKELLASESWSLEYQLSLALHESLAEVTYLTGDFNACEDYIEEVLVQAKTLLEKIKVYEIRIQAYTSQQKLLEAISIGREVLNKFGINFPEKPTPEDIQKCLEETAVLASDKTIEQLTDLPLLNNESHLAIMRIASSMIPPAYIADQMLFPLIILSQVNFSIKYGNGVLSAFIYACYAILLKSILDDIESAEKFSKLALKLGNKIDYKDINSKIYYVIGAFISHGHSHIKDTLPTLLNSYNLGLEVGSLDFVGYSAKEICHHSYFIGKELKELEQQTKNYIDVLDGLKQFTTSNCCKIFRQSILNFQSKDENFGILSGEAYNEYQSIASMIEANDASGLHYLYLHKLILCYWFEEYEQAQENANKAKLYLAAGTGFISIPNFNFYQSLTALALCVDSEYEQESLLALVTHNQLKLKKWADDAPMNYLHKFYLVEAEKFRVNSKFIQAIDAYERAITIAKENGYVHEEALANELAAKFYFKWDKQKIAKTYLNDAYYGYLNWGAKAKAKDLQKRSPQLLEYIPVQLEIDVETYQNNYINRAISLSKVNYYKTISDSKDNLSTSLSLDLESVIKASQSLSEQIQMEELLSTLMKVIMENTGASKCALILSKNANLDLELTAISCNHNISSNPTELPYAPLDSTDKVPVRLINYVKRIKETIVIDNAATEKFLAVDSYIIREQPKSILCMPIINQGKFFGILYLENRLTLGVFSPNRIKLLNLITNQAAISLKNAILYNNLVEAKEDLEIYNQSLEEKVGLRTQELNENNQRLKKTLKELQSTQSQLIQTEKMSSLGKMVAGISHEINNPVNFIHGNISHASKYVKYLLEMIAIYQQEFTESNCVVAEKSTEIDLFFILEDLPKILNSIEAGTSRIQDIVLGLRNFSRLDEAEMKSVDIHEGIENTLMILQHRFKSKDNFPKIQLIKEYGQLPEVTCYPSQLNQVFMSIIVNGIDALEELPRKGQIRENPIIRISTQLLDSNTVRILIADNGSGIEQKVQEKIFDPFFTTKPVGSGIGLGLSISYQIIVEKHKGHLICNSIVGEGTEFLIEIPIRSQ
ncbi:serine/threonine protein kinase with two-component sensor domain [Calothrix parasitica NIES-267]|uniref:histidine kinase n=1 Tax=Calothrix parasitica NIES-267 TaxID=1973488 RepID=A0A1Z4M0T6_9CYAN|nr:serine/threonine protein kinase with two-component sensor domain [Calothrix parasitica NIES-267]